MIADAGLSSIQRPNWIEIDLDALSHNIQVVKHQISPTSKILLPVKADAYGHGSLACSFAALRAGVDWLGVAHLFEAVLLRQYGVRSPILVLGTVTVADFPFLYAYQVIPSFADVDLAMSFGDWLASRNLKATVHLKVDTGMHRFGIACQDTDAILKVIKHPSLSVQGLFSHLATADIPGHQATQQQIQAFQFLLSKLDKQGMRPSICHLSNSAGVMSRVSPDLDMVRPGIALYGYNPMGSEPDPQLRPVLRMKATVRQIRRLDKGESVSYGHHWTAQTNTRVATVAIGYGDGYMRGDINSGVLFAHGKSCPILGRVCMDATMIDVSHVPELAVGDPVDVIHGELHPSISLESIAHRNHTISYEIATRVARRLYRQYTYQGRTLRWDELKILLDIPEFEEHPKDLFEKRGIKP